MPETFETKIRRVGTSQGILIPNEIMKKEHLKIGEKTKVTVFKELKREEKLELINKAFGSAKGAKPFERDKTDRF